MVDMGVTGSIILSGSPLSYIFAYCK